MNERPAVQSLAMLFGIAFLAIGILGFLPGITTHYGEMSFAGDDSGSELLGVFAVGILHNLVHVLSGIAGLSLSRTPEGGRTFLLGGGAIYLLLWILGVVGGAGWLPANSADDWLHLVLGVAMVGGGLATARDRGPATT